MEEFLMKKIIKKMISVCISMTMIVSLIPAIVSAESVESVPFNQQNQSDEGIIIVDLSEGTMVVIDPNDFEYVNLNMRNVSLPYNGGIAFGSGTTAEVNTPIFDTYFSNSTSQLKFAPSNFVGDKTIDITLYTHTAGTSANDYTAHELGKLSFNILVSYRILFTGSSVTQTDKLYLGFIPHSDCATSFDYTLSISN